MSADIPARRPVLNRAPTHPGALLHNTVLPALNITISEMAKKLHVSRQQLHRVLATNAGVSPEMALRLGKLCGNGPDVWLNMQKNHDLWHARNRIGKQIEEIETLSIAV